MLLCPYLQSQQAVLYSSLGYGGVGYCLAARFYAFIYMAMHTYREGLAYFDSRTLHRHLQMVVGKCYLQCYHRCHYFNHALADDLDAEVKVQI